MDTHTAHRRCLQRDERGEASPFVLVLTAFLVIIFVGVLALPTILHQRIGWPSPEAAVAIPVVIVVIAGTLLLLASVSSTITRYLSRRD